MNNKPYVLSVLRHIFAIFSSQISTMIETTDAILKHETTNRRWENNPRDKRFQESLFTIHGLAIDRGWKSDREIISFRYTYLRDGVERTLIIFDYY